MYKVLSEWKLGNLKEIQTPKFVFEKNMVCRILCSKLIDTYFFSNMILENFETWILKILKSASSQMISDEQISSPLLVIRILVVLTRLFSECSVDFLKKYDCNKYVNIISIIQIDANDFIFSLCVHIYLKF